MAVFLSICTIYDVGLGIFLVINPTILGQRSGATLNETFLYINTFLLFSLISVIITTSLFLRQFLRSKDARVRLKGKFIFLGIMIGVFSAIISIVISDTPFTIILTRSLYVVGNVFSYIGWLMPKKVAQMLIPQVIEQ